MEKLHRAVNKGAVEDVRAALAAGDADCVNKCGRKGLNAMHLAAQANDPEVLALLLSFPGADVNIKDEKQGWSALLHGLAASSGSSGDTTLLRQLLKARGCDVNTKDIDGNTPLHWAAMLNDAAAIELLHRHGALKDIANGAGETALHAAAKEGHEEAAAALLSCGFDVNARDGKGRTSLHVALESRETNLANLLLQAAQLDTAAADAEGNTPLHVAVREGLEGFAEKLVARGFLDTARNAAGQTAEDIRQQKQEAAQRKVKQQTAAREEKEERKRKQEEEDFERSAVTGFCRTYDVSEATARLLHRRGFRALDDEFFSLNNEALKKLCVTKKDQQKLEEGRLDHHAQIERAKQEELQRIAAAEAQKRRLRRMLGIVLVVAAFVAIYIALVIFISFFNRRN